MNELRHWTEILLASYQNVIDGVIEAIPRFVGGLVLLIAGWLFARFTAYLVVKSLKLVRFDGLMKKAQVEQFLQRAHIDKSPSELIGRMIYWVIILLVVAGFAEATHLDTVSEKVGALVAYIPNILMALLVLIVGLYFANTIREVIKTAFSSYAVKASRLISTIIFYLLVGVIVLTALDQLQLNVALLTSNVMILLGGVMIAFAIAYGLSARAVLPHIIASYYGKGQFQVGQKVRVGNVEGIIGEITSIFIVINTDEGRHCIPAKDFLNQEILVLATK